MIKLQTSHLTGKNLIKNIKNNALGWAICCLSAQMFAGQPAPEAFTVTRNLRVQWHDVIRIIIKKVQSPRAILSDIMWNHNLDQSKPFSGKLRKLNRCILLVYIIFDRRKNKPENIHLYSQTNKEIHSLNRSIIILWINTTTIHQTCSIN